MSSGRAANTKEDEGFAKRTVMVMVAEMAEARARMHRACVQFEALATAHGIKVDWDDHTAQ